MCDTKSEITTKEYTPWESHHETIFTDWADKASCYKWLHNKSYLKYSKKRNCYTIPVIIMSTLTGTANFALERVPQEYQSTCSIIIGSVNILAGIITTVSQFLKLNELTESHRTSYIAWDKFHRSIRLELIKAPLERIDVSYFMKTSRDEFDRLMETCPPVDRDIVSQFKNKLTTGVNKVEIQRKLKNYSKLIKPDLFDEIHSIKDVIYKDNNERDIERGERIKLEKLIIDRESYRDNVFKVKTFIEKFQDKYSRHPSQDELFSNISGIELPELKIIMNEIKTK